MKESKNMIKHYKLKLKQINYLGNGTIESKILKS